MKKEYKPPDMKLAFFKLLLALSLLLASTGFGQNKSFKILHSFNQTDGNLPSYVIQTTSGDIWGVTNSGGTGAPGSGVLYKITAAGAFSVVHNFSGKPDGANPGHLIQAADGSIYGVTALGGTASAGTVYRVDTVGNYTVLHSFNGSSEGKTPNFLAQANDGFIYGTASFFGTPMPKFNGTLFRINAAGSFAVLHTFQENIDGSNPDSVLQAADGFLYGTCRQDGPFGAGLGLGTFWRSDLAGNVALLHVFGPTTLDGREPTEPVGIVQAPDGLFYGSANKGGEHGNGAIFRLDAAGNLAVTHSYPDNAPDGSRPETNFTLGRDGFFYGSLPGGGLPESNTFRSGTLFRADIAGHVWVLHTFSGGDGGVPFAPSFLGARGTLYGTAQFQGPLGHGVIGSLAVKKNLPIASLTFSPNPVKPGLPTTASLTLSRPAGARGQVITLTHTGLLTVPATVTVPAGQTSIDFTVNTGQINVPNEQDLTAAISKLGVGTTSPLQLVP